MTITVGEDLTFREIVQERSGEDILACFYCQK